MFITLMLSMPLLYSVAPAQQTAVEKQLLADSADEVAACIVRLDADALKAQRLTIALPSGELVEFGNPPLLESMDTALTRRKWLGVGTDEAWIDFAHFTDGTPTVHYGLMRVKGRWYCISGVGPQGKRACAIVDLLDQNVNP